MRKTSNFLFKILLFVFIASNYDSSLFAMARNDSTQCIENAEEIARILGKDIVKLGKEVAGYSTKDTILIDDEDVQWKGKVFYKNGDRSFMAEVNWLDTVHISRITIFSKNICTKNKIHIGLSFGAMKDHVSKLIPSVPDGYFCLRDKDDKRINYWFNIDKYKKLGEGLFIFSKIPKNIIVESIVIDDKK